MMTEEDMIFGRRKEPLTEKENADMRYYFKRSSRYNKAFRINWLLKNGYTKNVTDKDIRWVKAYNDIKARREI